MGGVVEILNTKGSEFSISLYDIAGKLLFSENSKNNKVAINGSWFSSGYYVLHSKLYDGRQVSRFLVRY
jgi:hypothetical protein